MEISLTTFIQHQFQQSFIRYPNFVHIIIFVIIIISMSRNWQKSPFMAMMFE